MEVIRKKYENGLRSVSVLSKDTAAVTVMFLVGVGSRYETESESGLAHFVEHTLYKGTPTRPSSKIIGTEIESLGGSTNAFTSYDYTGYYIKAPAINYNDSFDILTDIFRNSKFDQTEIDKERGVIIEEIKMYEDRPTSKVMQEWNQNFFKGNNLGKEITGTIESVSNLNSADFHNFIDKHYYAENILVVVAGNVTQDQVDQQIKQNLLDIPSLADKGIEKSGFSEFLYKNDTKRFVPVEKDVEQAHIVIGGPGFSRHIKRRYDLQVANAILGKGFGSKLFEVIRDELGLAYYVYSRLNSFEDTGSFNIGMGVDRKRFSEAMNAVNRIISELREGAFTKAEFDRAKNYLIGNLITDLETSEDVASYYGMQDLLKTEQLSIIELRDMIQSVKLESVAEIIREIFDPTQFSHAVLAKNAQELEGQIPG